MTTEEKRKEELVQKWNASGMLEGLQGHIREDIAQLYASQERYILNEQEPDISKLPFMNMAYGIVKSVSTLDLEPLPEQEEHLREKEQLREKIRKEISDE